MHTIFVDDTHERRLKLLHIVNQFREKGKLVNRYALQPELEKQGFTVSFVTIYRNMTSINQKKTWVRDLTQSNYSAYRKSISQNLEWVEQQAQQKFEETGNHVWLNIIHSVQQTKMKHTNGENINISAVMLGKKFKELSNNEENQEELAVDVIKLASKKT